MNRSILLIKRVSAFLECRKPLIRLLKECEEKGSVSVSAGKVEAKMKPSGFYRKIYWMIKKIHHRGRP